MHDADKSRITPSSVPNLSSRIIENPNSLNPQEVVILYFQSWNSKKYDAAYSLISDGFRQTEPTAGTPDGFRSYMGSFFDDASAIDIVQAKASYKNDNEAMVDYKIEIEKKDGTRKLFNSQYTLIRMRGGWKIINPYGGK